MNITPAFLKERTDLALSLLEEFKKINYDELKLKPRETKAVYQVSVILHHKIEQYWCWWRFRFHPISNNNLRRSIHYTKYVRSHHVFGVVAVCYNVIMEGRCEKYSRVAK